MDKQISCKEFERLIPGFISRKLEYRTLKRFCNHAEICQDCHEELDIQYLVAEGLTRLEEGDAFDLNRELDKCLMEAQRKIKRNERYLNVGASLELIAMVAIGCVILWIIFR